MYKNFKQTSEISNTHGYYEESDATNNHRIRKKLQQRDVRKQALDALRKSDNFMVLGD